jgi:hypothetical protein
MLPSALLNYIELVNSILFVLIILGRPLLVLCGCLITQCGYTYWVRFVKLPCWSHGVAVVSLWDGSTLCSYEHVATDRRTFRYILLHTCSDKFVGIFCLYFIYSNYESKTEWRKSATVTLRTEGHHCGYITNFYTTSYVFCTGMVPILKNFTNNFNRRTYCVKCTGCFQSTICWKSFCFVVDRQSLREGWTNSWATGLWILEALVCEFKLLTVPASSSLFMPSVHPHTRMGFSSSTARTLTSLFHLCLSQFSPILRFWNSDQTHPSDEISQVQSMYKD